jgi:uncharacterized protein (UPF0333 family)
MNKTIMSRKGQLSIEAAVILLFILILLPSLWLGGPIQQSTEKSTDTNAVLLAHETLGTIASNAEMAWMSGPGAVKDFAIHIPFNTIDIEYGNGSYVETGSSVASNGPHINFSVLFYNPLPQGASEQYFVNDDGDPAWFGGNRSPTPFYYINLTKGLKYPLLFGESNGGKDLFPLCREDLRKNSIEIRGPGTIFKFIGDDVEKPITFCCESGFNIHILIERSFDKPNILRMLGRVYFGASDELSNWNLALA